MKTARSFLKLPIAERQTGFTLNEVLVSINVIIIAILGYSLSTVGVIRGNMTNDNTTVAINLAQDKLEQLKAQKKIVNDDRCPSSGDHAITNTGMANGIFEHTRKKAGWGKEVGTAGISAPYRYSHAFRLYPESSRLSPN
jgi:Tfp pilus assembly protein PilV